MCRNNPVLANGAHLCLLVTLIIFLVSCTTLKAPSKTYPQIDRVSILSWNVHYAILQEGEPDPWDPESHSAGIAALIQTQSPDLAGLQEILTVDPRGEVLEPLLTQKLIAKLSPEYGHLAPKGAGVMESMNPILYRKSRFTPLSSGMIALGPTPTIPDSRNPGDALPRMSTWAVLYDHFSGQLLGMINTHWDHINWGQHGEAARQILDLQERLKAFYQGRKIPFVLTGDFNEFPSAKGRTLLAEAMGDDPGHGGITFPFLLGLGFPLDAVLFSSPLEVVDYQILDVGGKSDHRAVFAALRY
jgi:endonuclease/exonuclease/phosphatase family metal-dependent hydrolase